MEIRMELYKNCIERNNAWVETARALFALQNARKHLEAQEEDLKDKLKAMSEDKSSKGEGYVFEVIERKGNVDYTAIPQLKGVDLNLYRKESSVAWKLTYVGAL